MEKKYALPYRALDALVAHFMRFLEDTRVMPVIWHQSLLAFVQRLEISFWYVCYFQWSWMKALLTVIVLFYENILGSFQSKPVLCVPAIFKSLLWLFQPIYLFNFWLACFLYLLYWDVITFRYKNDLQKEDKDNLRLLLGKQKHKLVRTFLRRSFL